MEGDRIVLGGLVQPLLTSPDVSNYLQLSSECECLLLLCSGQFKGEDMRSSFHVAARSGNLSFLYF